MGRKRRHDRNLPENMRRDRRTGAYYFTVWTGEKPNRKQKWLPLGKEPGAAFVKYRELAGSPAPDGRTVDHLCDRFDLEVIPAKRESTQRNYRYWMVAVRKTWGHMALEDLKQPDVANFLDTYPKKVTANRVVTLLVTMLKKAKRWGWVSENRIAGIERHVEKPRKRTIKPEEWQKLLEAASPEYRLLLRLARFTALRRGDVCRLTWGCVQGTRFTVKPQKSADDLAPLSILVAGDLAEVIGEMRRGLTPFPTRRMFTVAKGRPLSSKMLGYHFDAIREKAELTDINFHDIRRTRLTELAEKYGKPFAQKVAGHLSPRTTDGYVVPEAVLIDWPEQEIRGTAT